MLQTVALAPDAILNASSIVSDLILNGISTRAEGLITDS
jgi:hypothetical protein